jgi:hypothetical protein
MLKSSMPRVLGAAALLSLSLLAGCLFETERVAGGGSDIGNGSAVAGLVLDGNGKPAQGVTVRLRPSDYLAPLPSLARGAALDTAGEVRTSADGRFRLAGLDTGDYRLEFLAADPALGALVDLSLKAGVKTLELPGTRLGRNGSLRLVLPAGTDTGKAVVRFFGMERSFTLRTGIDTVIGGLPAGLHGLRISSPVASLDGLEARGLEVRPDSVSEVRGLAEPCGDRACDSTVLAGFLRDNGLPVDMGRVANASGRVTDLVFDFADTALRIRDVGSLGRLSRVKTLRMQGPLLPDSLGAAFFDALARMDSLWFLHLDGGGEQGLERIPASLGKLRNLSQLYLMNDSLVSLPASLGDLRKLEMLFLRGNRLETLPEGVGTLPLLKELHVSFNRLTALPEGLYASASLIKLDLFANRLCDLDGVKVDRLKALGADPTTSGQVCP